MLKFFHLLCGVTFFGIIIATFFYIASSIRKNDRALINYSLKASYCADCVIFFIAIIQFITAIKLVVASHFDLSIPWIFIAYHAFAAIILLWLLILFIKFLYLSKPVISPIAKKIFYLLNIMMILIFIIVIHDAVTQSTWFTFLFRR